jgi:Rps23 Pro-64 3,4-dihydroxylase Tpa1-like proline 4-hydroxylase
VLKDPRPLPVLDNSTFSSSRCSVHPLPPEITGSWFTNRKPFAIVIDNVLTLEECQAWIENTEFHSQTGYETALVNIGGGRQKAMLDYRKSSRCIIDDIPRAQELFARIKPFLTKAVATAASAAADESNVTNPSEEAVDEESDELISIHDRIPYELNERFRFLRYDPGEYFAPHMDGRYDRPSNHPRDGDFSLITFQLYLNDGFVGGTTRFFHSNTQEYYDVVPKAGSVLLFEHRLEHSGEVVAEGRKYAMRTDIMFAKPESIK